jgi:hypothetical protein
MRLRRAAVFSIFALAITSLSVTAHASDAIAPTETIRNFYGWYLTQINANREPGNARDLMRRYVTRRFLGEVEQDKKKDGGLGADPFIAAQDVDDLWAKNIFVSDVQIDGDRATAQVWLKGKTKEMQRRLRVSLVNERGSWKVDRVEPRD